MTKYDALRLHLSKLSSDQWHATFAEIEKLLGAALPASAHNYEAWWGNKKGGHPQTEAWLNAGWDIKKVDLKAKKVSFIRTSSVRSEVLSKTKLSRGARAPKEAPVPEPWSWDGVAEFKHQIVMTWKPLGRVTLDIAGKVQFPKPAEVPGLYRFQIRHGSKRVVYIGESDNLRRRFSNYRNPGPTQQTSLRINDEFRRALQSGAEIGVAIATNGSVTDLSGADMKIDFGRRACRRLFENYAQVVGGGVDIEFLNR